MWGGGLLAGVADHDRYWILDIVTYMFMSLGSNKALCHTFLILTQTQYFNIHLTLYMQDHCGFSALMLMYVHTCITHTCMLMHNITVLGCGTKRELWLCL